MVSNDVNLGVMNWEGVHFINETSHTLTSPEWVSSMP